MIDPALRDSLSAFDNQTLATLANPGLVRRARRDLEEGRLRLLLAGDGRAEVEADGQLVTIDARGPRLATCACKSVAVCRHRIAAVLFLQGTELSGDKGEPAAEAESAAEPEAIIAGLDMGALEKWAGKAAWRAACELVDKADAVELSNSSVSVQFAELDDPVRILRGQGFDGIVSKAPKARRKPYHAAAVLAARRKLGLAMPEPGDEPEPDLQSIEVDRAFLGSIANALRECALLGFNLAPVPLEESLFELSVSSRADSLPRLGGLLRALAAQVRLRRQRSFTYDPDQLLELLATGFALVRTLAAGSDPDRLPHLAGNVRRSYSPLEPIELVGCGGENWRTTTGAKGVTAWFHEPATGRWFSASVARGSGQDPTFSPLEAWRSQSMWRSGPLAVLAHARIMLTGAGASADGRLSAPAEAQAKIIQADVAPEPSWPGIVRLWSDLRSEYHRQAGTGLDGTSAPAVCLIAAQGSATPYFDDLAQQLIWPVRDMRGEWLALTLDHEEPMTRSIEALEASLKPGWDGMVLVRLAREGGKLVATPLTLFDRTGPVDLTLWRPARAPASRTSTMLDWLLRLRKAGGHDFARIGIGPTETAIASAWRQLLDLAEIGAVQGSSLETKVAAHAERLDSFGLPALASLLRKASRGDGEAMLAAAYGLMLARQQRCALPMLH
jgi:hypothetical protein